MLALTGWQQVIVDVGAVLGALAAIITTLALLARTRPARWVWARLVADPFAHWTRERIPEATADIRAELRENGGTSLRDAIVRIEARQERDGRRLDRLEGKRDPQARTRSTDRMGA